MSIILLGGTGYIGSAFAAELTHRGHKFFNLSRQHFNYTQPAGLDELLTVYKPSFVINAAGYTGKPNVDACEDHKGDTLHGNVIFPAVLAEACWRHSIPWGHVSTGCLYNGHPPMGYYETEPPNFSFSSPPCSFYSGTKALAEELLTDQEVYVWRMRMPFDSIPHPKNYLTKLLTYDKVLDQNNSLSHRGQCVAACIDLWEKKAPYGIYHVTNPGHDFTMRICETMIAVGLKKEFTYFASDAEFDAAVKAPRTNCFLNTDKLRAQGIYLPHVRETMDKAIFNYAEQTRLTSVLTVPTVAA